MKSAVLLQEVPGIGKPGTRIYECARGTYFADAQRFTQLLESGAAELQSDEPEVAKPRARKKGK